MATNLEEIYPFATQDGKAIPLDILKPSYLLLCAYTESAVATYTLPEDAQVAMFISAKDCLVSFENDLTSIATDGTAYAKTLVIPGNTIVSSACSSLTMKVKGIAESGTLYVQLIEKWAGLALDRQYSRK